MGMTGIFLISVIISIIGLIVGYKSGRKHIMIPSIILFVMCCGLFILLYRSLGKM